MTPVGPDEKVYPVTKLATVADALLSEGATLADALGGTRLSKDDLSTPATRVSLSQILECYRNAGRLARDPDFPYRAGLRFHVSTYGMYGFAILSCVDFRQTMRFAVEYHRLATPTADISFSEQDGYAIWDVAPLAHLGVDTALYRFLVELQIAAHISLHRDVMDPAFAPKVVRLAYGAASEAARYSALFGCDVLLAQPQNQLVFDAKWLDETPRLGNELTYATLTKLCDELLEDFQLNTGLAGKVREILLRNLARPVSFEAAASRLAMTPRTLRRKLQEEKTSYRDLIDELRMRLAVKYLRDTQLTIEDIAASLGFSESANFRRAFRRWTAKAPQEFRRRPDGPNPE